MPVEATEAAATETIAPSDSSTSAAAVPNSMDGAFKLLLAPIESALETVAQRLSRLESGRTVQADPTENAEGLKDLKKRQGVICNALNDLSDRIRQIDEKLAQLMPEQDVEDLDAPDLDDQQNSLGDAERWGRVILGEQLSDDQGVAEARDRLLEDALAMNQDAVGLAARLMLAQSAPRDALPPLMKELGEAYYRWNPKTTSSDDPVELALIGWLHKRLSSEGLRNRIDIVRVGDQFDASRHQAATGPGIEVAQVCGWVVLRDNGRPLSKAKVALKNASS